MITKKNGTKMNEVYLLRKANPKNNAEKRASHHLLSLTKSMNERMAEKKNTQRKASGFIICDMPIITGQSTISVAPRSAVQLLFVRRAKENKIKTDISPLKSRMGMRK